MAEYILTKKSNLIAVADSVRGRTGETDKITLGEMIDDINYVIGGADTSDATAQASEILSGETAYISGGKVTGTMPNNGAISSTMDGINTKSIAIPQGYTSGGAVSLDNTIDNEVDAQTDLIEQIKNTVNELPDASSIKPTLQTKSVTPSTSQQTVAPDFGYDGLENVTVDAIPSEYIVTNDATAIAADILNSKTAYIDGNKVTGTMANNGSISTSMDGINVKSVTIPQGYTSGGTVSLDNTIDNEVDTQTDLIAQITTALEGKMAGSSEPVLQDKTVTPTANEQIVAADNGYDGLNEVTVIGDANLVAENIKSGVSIFGVSGTLVEGGGSGEAVEWSENEDAILNGTLSSYSNDRITKLASCAFYGNQSLTTVNFPKVSTIGSSAFYQCGNLSAINFPSAKLIYDSAFRQCFNLKSVNFPVASTIGAGAFSRCEFLTAATFPAAITISGSAFCECFRLSSISFPSARTIGSNAFGYCSSLTTINFPKASAISDNAFIACSSLTTANFPNVSTIGSSAFYSCSKLNSVSFPSVKIINGSAFGYCSSLEVANFSRATTIGNGAFYGCSKLNSISFPACTHIEFNAFGSCPSLTSVNFPACTNISANAFAFCSSLTTASFPACAYISANAFSKCYNLSQLYLTGYSVCKLSASNAFTSTPIGGYSTSAGTYGSIYVPGSLLTSYKTATNWTYFSNRFVALVGFTIDGYGYHAKNGMTWADWCNSDFNTNANISVDKGYLTLYGRAIVQESDSSNIMPDDSPINGANYVRAYDPDAPA